MFSVAQNTHRDSQNWTEKRWWREELEEIWGRKRGTQEEKDTSTQLSVPRVFSGSPDTHKDSQNWIGKRRGKEEIEVF